MIIVRGTARFAPGEVDRLRPALVDYVTQTRREDGCLSYHYAVDLVDPDLVHTIETWQDRQAKDVHMQDLGALLVALEAAQLECLSVKAYEARFLETVLGDETSGATELVSAEAG